MFNYKGLIASLIIVFTTTLISCGGGGGGGGGGSSSNDTATNNDPPPVTEDPVLTIGQPTTNTSDIEPSVESKKVIFTVVVSGNVAPPGNQLYLDELNADGSVAQLAVAILRDDGAAGVDQSAGDNVYSGAIEISSVEAAEKYYRARAGEVDQLGEVTSTSGNIWISGCPVRARPSNPQFAVELADGAQIFSNEVMITVAAGVRPDLDTINDLVRSAIDTLDLSAPVDPDAETGVETTVEENVEENSEPQPSAKVVGCIPKLRQYLIEIQNHKGAEGVELVIDTLKNVDGQKIVNASANARLLEMPRVNAVCEDGYACEWYLEHVRAPEAWSIGGAGSKELGVAMIDFGVDCRHPQLDCDETRHNQDSIDHGTGIASLIGARKNAETDLVGVAWKTSLHPFSFLGAAGSQYKMSELITLSSNNPMSLS